jgi:predicted amidohydrolase YtcJ
MNPLFARRGFRSGILYPSCFCFWFCFCCFCATLNASAADLVIRNAKVWTGDPVNPSAEVIVLEGGRILAVGGAELAHSYPEVRTLDAGGRRVIPGMTDCHTHIVNGGLGLQRLQLRDARNREDFVQLVRSYAVKLGPDEWVVGRGWTVESWNDTDSPERGWIDEACGGRPAFLTRMDGHQVLVNSAAPAFSRTRPSNWWAGRCRRRAWRSASRPSRKRWPCSTGMA